MSVKTTTGFMPFQLVYGLEVVIPIEFEISSLWLAVEFLSNTYGEEEQIIYLTHSGENRHDTLLANETHKNHTKAEYDKPVHSWIF